MISFAIIVQPAKALMQSTIKNESWYYGMCTKDMIERILVMRGDFLVRLVQKEDNCWLVLHVKNDNSVDSFRISCSADEKKFILVAAKKDGEPAPQFDSPLQLIKHYREHRLPNKLRLHRPIKRPSWLIPQRDVEYKTTDMMGTGNFSEVFRGRVRVPAGDRKKKITINCAIKVLKKDLPVNANLLKFLDEARLQAGYDHENVVQVSRLPRILCRHTRKMSAARAIGYLASALMGPSAAENIRIRGVMLDCMPMMMIMELCHGGSLDKHLQKKGPEISSFEKQVYLLEAAMGMRYLHTQGCIHRDLAARNCLIGDNGKVKISDFGLSLFSPDGETLNVKMHTVPLRWMAPECLRRDQSFSFKTDVWAYGVLIFEVFSNGSKPFADYETDSSETRMIKAIKKADMPPPPVGTPEGVGALINEIWQKNSERRPDFVDIVKVFCNSVRLETAVPLDQLVVNQLPGVKKTELPDFDWTEEKAREEEKRKKRAETEENDRRLAEKKKRRDEFRAKRDQINSTNSKSKDKEQCSNDTGTDSELPLPVFHPEGKQSTRRNNEAGGGGTKWLTATITKLKGGLKTKKDHNVVVMEKRFEVAEAKKKNDSAREKAGSRREKKQ